jgi:hypothetical protein
MWENKAISENTEQQLENIEAMFVQCAHGMTTSKGTVTFHGPAYSTQLFVDRQERVVGHMYTRIFMNE